MITDTIDKQIAQAMKAKDEIKLSTLKLLSSSLHYEMIEKQHDLSEEEEIVVVQREAKKRKDAIDAYKQVGATDRAEKEKKELEILEEYLPEQLSDEELENMVEAAINEIGASSMADMGKVIGKVMGEAKGKADGKKVSELAKEKLVSNG
jgi:uncharacterized protein YqeY